MQISLKKPSSPEKSLSSLDISEADIFAIIKNLESIRMTKLHVNSIKYPSKLIFGASLREIMFPSCWKKTVVKCTKRKIKS